MCLLGMDGKPTRKFGIGYKSVRKIKGRYTCYDYAPKAGTVIYPLNQWITDPNDGKIAITFSLDRKYRTGFHISLDKKATLGLANITGNEVVIRVRFRKVTATQCFYPDNLYGRQVVAREIMNLGEIS